MADEETRALIPYEHQRRKEGEPPRDFLHGAHGTQQAAKAAFLANFRETGIIRAAAQAAGVNRTTFYRWTETDQYFTLAYEQARIDAKEKLEIEARRRALEGVAKVKGIYYKGQRIDVEIVREYSDALLMFLLKALDPEKYRENINLTQTQVIKTIDKEAWDSV